MRICHPTCGSGGMLIQAGKYIVAHGAFLPDLDAPAVRAGGELDSHLVSLRAVGSVCDGRAADSCCSANAIC